MSPGSSQAFPVRVWLDLGAHCGPGFVSVPSPAWPLQVAARWSRYPRSSGLAVHRGLNVPFSKRGKERGDPAVSHLFQLSLSKTVFCHCNRENAVPVVCARACVCVSRLGSPLRTPRSWCVTTTLAASRGPGSPSGCGPVLSTRSQDWVSAHLLTASHMSPGLSLALSCFWVSVWHGQQLPKESGGELGRRVGQRHKPQALLR